MTFIIIKTIKTYLFWILTTITLMPICWALSFLPKSIRYDNRVYFFFSTVWSRLLIFFTFVHLKIKGEENLPPYPTQPSIFVANHLSALDIPLIDSLIGTYPHIWISQEGYGKVFMFGTILRRMHILIDRNNPRKAVLALQKTVQLAENKNRHIIIFPEGTRSVDGSLGAFNSGFVHLALKLNRPIIPVFISGANKIMKKNSYLINPRATTISLEVGNPFLVAPDESKEEFIKRVKEWFEDKLNKD